MASRRRPATATIRHPRALPFERSALDLGSSCRREPRKGCRLRGSATRALLAIVFLSLFVRGAPAPAQDAGASGDGLGDLSRAMRALARKTRAQVVSVELFERVAPRAGSGGAGGDGSEEIGRGTTLAYERRSLRACSGLVWGRGRDILTLLPGGLPSLLSRREGGEGELGIEVLDAEGVAHAARWIATDLPTGVTILRLEKVSRALKPVSLRKGSARLEDGQVVAARGRSGFHWGTVTRARRWVHGRGDDERGLPTVRFPRAIATSIDAVPGDVGGLLADDRGACLGMLAFESRSEQGTGPGSPRGAHASRRASARAESDLVAGKVLAIPADLLQRIAAELARGGAVTRGAIGARFCKVTSVELDVEIGSGRAGAYLLEIIPGGPAERAGLREGDVIIEVDGRLIRGMDDIFWFAERVEYGRPGDEVTVRYFSHQRDRGGMGPVRKARLVLGDAARVLPRSVRSGEDDGSASPSGVGPASRPDGSGD